MEIEDSRQLAIIASEIQQMAQEDQEARRVGDQQSTAAVDQKNKEQLENIMQRIGWPTKSKVGEEAAHMAWLIVQHADEDPTFQERCFELMSAEPETEVSLEDRAYLEDRILVKKGRPQLYGTQWRVDENGAYGPEEIETRDRLDERRAAVGMEPFADYAEVMQDMYRNLPKQRDGERNDI